MVEEEELRLFLEAYEHATGERLACRRHESPDFVCVRVDRQEVGVELTRVTRSPDERFADRVLLRRDEQDNQESLDEIWRLLQDKEAKHARHYGYLADRTILVLQLFDCPLHTLSPLIDESLQCDFSENGFLEVWLADYTGMEAYGDIELFGLKPEELWGYYPNPTRRAKPFG